MKTIYETHRMFTNSKITSEDPATGAAVEGQSELFALVGAINAAIKIALATNNCQEELVLLRRAAEKTRVRIEHAKL